MTFSRDQLVDLARRHAALEGDPDLSAGVGPAIDAVLATLDDDPLYELLPAGVTFRGRDAARRYYEHFFSTFRPTVAGGKFVCEYVGPDGLCLEYEIEVRLESGEVERHRIISVLVFGQDALSGERVYGSEEFLRLLFGPMWS
jgi:hypothetical protein